MKDICYTVHTKTILGDTDEMTFKNYVDARKYFEKMVGDEMASIEIYDRRDRLLLRWDGD